MKKTLPTLALAAALTLAGCGSTTAHEAASTTPSTSPSTIAAQPAASSRPAPFKAPHVVKATREDGYLWVVTDLPNTAASVKIARGLCTKATAYAVDRYGRAHFGGVSIRAKGDRGRLILRPTLADRC